MNGINSPVVMLVSDRFVGELQGDPMAPDLDMQAAGGLGAVVGVGAVELATKFAESGPVDTPIGPVRPRVRWGYVARTDTEIAMARLQQVTESALFDYQGVEVFPLEVDRDKYAFARRFIAEDRIWYKNHHLDDEWIPTAAIEEWDDPWAAYVGANAELARQLAPQWLVPTGSTVSSQDHYFATLAQSLKRYRRDISVRSYSHTPSPLDLDEMPHHIRSAWLAGWASYDRNDFQTDEFRTDFVRLYSGTGIRPAATATNPVRPSSAGVRATARTGLARRIHSDICRWAGDDGIVVVAIARLDPTKAVPVWAKALKRMVEKHPELRSRIKPVLITSATRSGERYLAHGKKADSSLTDLEQALVPGAVRIYRDMKEHAYAVAAVMRADVMTVSSPIEGNGIVNDECGAVNERNARQLTSIGTGYAQAGSHVGADSGVLFFEPPSHPEDPTPEEIDRFADLMHKAVTMDDAEAARRFALVREAAELKSPLSWALGLIGPAPGEDVRNGIMSVVQTPTQRPAPSLSMQV